MSFLTLSLPKEEATICLFERPTVPSIPVDHEGRDAERVHHVLPNAAGNGLPPLPLP